MRVGGPLERERRADLDAQLARVEVAGGVLQDLPLALPVRLPAEHGGRGHPGEGHPQAPVVHDLDRLLLPRALRVGHQVPVGADQRERLGEGPAADGVVDHVGAVGPGPRTHRRAHVRVPVVDAQLGPERGRQVRLRPRGDGRGHPGAGQPGELDGHVPDAARPRLHQDELALADPGALEQGLPGDDRHQRRGGRLGERQARGLTGREPLVDDPFFLVGAWYGTEAAVAEVHLVPGTEPGDARPGLLYHPGAVPAEHGGQRPAERPAGPQLGVDRVDAGGGQPDLDVPVAGEPRLGHLREP